VIFECNENCKCNIHNCCLSPTDYVDIHSLCLKRIRKGPEIMWGLSTLVDIRKGSPIIE